MAKGRVPYSQDAEEAIIASVLIRPDRVEELGAELTPEDFYIPKHQALYSAFLQLYALEGVKPDPISLADRAKQFGVEVDPADLVGVMTGSIGTITRENVEIVRRDRVARDLIFQCRETLQAISEGEDPFELAESLEAFSRGVGTVSREPQAITYPELAAMADTTAPWIIPGMLKQDWRAIVVAAEGVGKAVLMRTMCMTIAQGRHPLTHRECEPHKTLLVDLENPAEAITETGDKLESTIKVFCPDYDPTWFKIWHKIGGINIRKRSDRADLKREIAAHQPRLVCIGPLYKLYRRKSGEAHEDAADEVISILDELRTKYGFALVLEHHVPKGQSGSLRDLTPMGSQRWMAWPEIGIGLRPDDQRPGALTLERFRNSRLKEDWPDEIHRDDSWLWTGMWRNGIKF